MCSLARHFILCFVLVQSWKSPDMTEQLLTDVKNQTKKASFTHMFRSSDFCRLLIILCLTRPNKACRLIRIQIVRCLDCISVLVFEKEMKTYIFPGQNFVAGEVISILKAKSNFKLLLHIPFLVIGK